LEAVLQSGQKTAFTYLDNTGIIVAYNVGSAVSLIRANPVGLQLQP